MRKEKPRPNAQATTRQGVPRPPRSDSTIPTERVAPNAKERQGRETPPLFPIIRDHRRKSPKSKYILVSDLRRPQLVDRFKTRLRRAFFRLEIGCDARLRPRAKFASLERRSNPA